MRARGVVAIGLAILLGAASNQQARAQEEPSDLTRLNLKELLGVDVVAVNVLGMHTHLAGQWMVGYEFTFENMDGNREGTRRVSHAKVEQAFMTVPTDMTMQMQMGMLMYAPSDDLSLMAMVGYIRKAMNHVTADGARFRELSEGLGDLQLRGLYTVYRVRGYEHRFLLDPGISIPTGSIDKKDFGPDRSLGRERLEYPMQLGSGTVDLLPGLAYLGQTRDWAWGAEFLPTIRLGRNSHNYALGNRYELKGWATRKIAEWMSISARVDGQMWDNIHGADQTLVRTDEPTKDPNRQGGDRIDMLVGLNFYVPRGPLKGQRLAIEFGAPVYQRLDGPQLQTDWVARAAWQWVF
jgi:hypothetical protein